MHTEHQLWSVKKVADFLSASENYTRNVLVKQPDFPQARYANIVANGKTGKSKPRWLNREVIEWAELAYVPEADYSPPAQKKRGRPRRTD